MNVFNNPAIAKSYDEYYQSGFGKSVDKIEKRIITDLIKDIPREHMLELGCGTGHWSEYFVNQGFEVTGVDSSDIMLELARLKSLKVEFIKGDAQNLPYENEAFSIVSTITMLEFVDDQNMVLQEIYRVLRPGGWLITGCLNANSVIGQTNEQDEVFKSARFLTHPELIDKLKIFGTPVIEQGVYLTSDFKIMDDSPDKESLEAVFMASLVQKTK